MARLKIGNFATDLTNVVGGMLKGKKEEEDSNEAKDLRRRMDAREAERLALDEENSKQANARGNQSLDLERLRLSQSNDANQLEQNKFDYTKGENTRVLSERSTHEAALRARAKQLFGNLAGSDQMSEGELNGEIEREENKRAREAEIKTGKQFDMYAQYRMLNMQLNQAAQDVNVAQKFWQQQSTAAYTNPNFSKYMKSGMSMNDALRKTVTDMNGGRDVYGEWTAASMNYANTYRNVQTMGAGANAPGLSPLANKAVQDNVPWDVKSPEQQAETTQRIMQSIKSGLPIDPATRASGAPVDKIAASAGMQYDANSGMVTKPGQAPSAAPAPTGSPNFDNVLMRGANAAPPNHMTAPNILGSATTAPAMPAPIPATSAAPASSTVAPAAPAPAPALPSAAPTLPPLPAARPPASMPTLPSATAGDTSAQGDPRAPYRNALANARNLPEAEQSARALLNMGLEYNDVIASVPQQFQSMIAAKLPKRIPSSPLLPPPPMSNFSPMQILTPNASPFTPAPSKPSLFTPPDV